MITDAVERDIVFLPIRFSCPLLSVVPVKRRLPEESNTGSKFYLNPNGR